MSPDLTERKAKLISLIFFDSVEELEQQGKFLWVVHFAQPVLYLGQQTFSLALVLVVDDNLIVKIGSVTWNTTKQQGKSFLLAKDDNFNH